MNPQNLQSSNCPIIPFQPQTESEEVTARVVRMMLKFEVVRVQLENGLLELNETERLTMRQDATAIRVDGFRIQRRAIDRGIKVSYDDELLRREGTRIAYLLARNAIDQATLVEEQVVAISVNQALYEIDEDYILIQDAA
jgi:hypothetical protein